MATFDTATPAGTDLPSVLDDRIREAKAGVQERQNVDHYWPLTGTQVSDADAGKHRQVTFQAALAEAPTVVEGQGILYLFGDPPELYWKDDEGNVRQLTSGGALNVAATEAVLPTGDQTITGTKTFSDAPVLNGGFLIGQNTDLGNYQLRARQFYADVATGTAPLVVASTTKVTNLNADQVDGLSLAKYDSGWFAASKGVTYSKAHGFGAVPTMIQVWYSDTADGSGDVVVLGADTNDTHGTMATVVDVDATYIHVRGHASIARYRDLDDVWHNETSGYLRITALRVF